jgi:hypothetical protein
LSNLAIAFVIGVGTAVSVVGAVVGTLLPLSGSTATAIEINLVDGIILFVGVASTLIYFQYLARRTPDGEIVRSRPVRAISAVGQVFVVVTMGAIYGGAILTSITIFAERVGFILSFGGG